MLLKEWTPSCKKGLRFGRIAELIQLFAKQTGNYPLIIFGDGVGDDFEAFADHNDIVGIVDSDALM